MKRSLELTFACLAFSAALFCATGVNAQEDQQDVAIIEIFACNYNAGNDMDDLLAVTSRWNAWADRNSLTDYTAIILTPYLYSEQIDFDVAWLGVYPSGEAMGAGEGVWFASGQDLQADFDEVVSCAAHTQFAGLAQNTPAEPASATGGLLGLQNCTFHEGHIFPEAQAAIGQWSSYLEENGSDLFMGVLFPLAGESSEASYAFKAATGFDSTQAYGHFLDVYVGGGFQRADEIFDRIIECDNPRLYVTNRVRTAAGE